MAEVRETVVVGILMGSDSDLAVMEKAAETLAGFGVAHEVRVLSAHRSPRRTADYATSAAARGLKVIIAGAGGAAHLAGVVAAHTTLPVVAVPLNATPLGGLDALLASVQMPTGIPVATVAVGGAANAALLAVAILALGDEALAARLVEHRRGLDAKAAAADEKVQRALASKA